MPTLYVENVPEALHQALRERARRNRRPVCAEVIALLEEHVPTSGEMARRRELLEVARKIRARRPSAPASFPSSEKMQREDRRR